MPALNSGRPCDVWGEAAEGEVGGDGAPLMLLNGEAGFLGDPRLTHPILCRRPIHIADPLHVPAHLVNVCAWFKRPLSKHRQFGEAARIERPTTARPLEGFAVRQATAGDEQMNVRPDKERREVRAEVEPAPLRRASGATEQAELDHASTTRRCGPGRSPSACSCWPGSRSRRRRSCRRSTSA